MPHEFQSDDWFDEVERIRAGLDPAVPESLRDLLINVSVTGGPQGDRDMHIGGGRFLPGLADAAPTRLHVPYDIARAMFLEGDTQKAMEAFLSGEILVEGDMAKLMQMQAAQPGAGARELAERIRAATV